MKQAMMMIALCLLPFALARKLDNEPQDTLAFASDKKVGTCSSHVCSYGYHPKTNDPNITGNASDTNCCDPTCAKWNCTNGWKAHPGYFSNVGQSNEECCDKTCSLFTECGEGTNNLPSKDNEAGVTQEECCGPICQVHSCIGNWVQDLSKKDVVSSRNEDCCAQSCFAVNCESPELVPDLQRVDTAGSTTEYCCQKTCSYYKSQCPANTGVPDDKVLKVPSDSTEAVKECCDAKCSGHTCATGYTLIPAKWNQYVKEATGQGCCEKQCKAFKCSSGYAKVPDNENQTAPNDLTCCEATCALYKCPFGYLYSKDPAKLTMTSRSDENCCETSCKSHQCPTGMVLRPLPFNITAAGGNDSHAACCESTTCKELRFERTPTSVQQGDSTEGLDCSDFDASAEKNCTTKYKLFNVSGNLTAVPCMLDPTLGHCKMDDTQLVTDCSELGLEENASM